MPIDLFGFSIGRKGREAPKPIDSNTEGGEGLSFVAPDSYDGTINVEAGGIFGHYVNFDEQVKNEYDLIQRYRAMAMYPEVDIAITDIVNDALVMDESKRPVELILENVKLSDNIKNKVQEEFETVLSLYDFNNKAYDLFRRWYVDSKLYYHIIIDDSNPKLGIKELRAIDPLKINKVRKVEKDTVKKNGGSFPVVKGIEEFYIYKETDKNSLTPTPQTGLKISPDSIIYCHSGLIEYGNRRVVGYLSKAIRPLNMLRQIEDSVVIYRMSRAPERRVFYIDVGNLPKDKAEQYMRSQMTRYRNKITYDQNTGEMRDDRRHSSILEDYWLPRREGGRGTEITSLDGGQNLGEMEDVEYFMRKLYRALNVPPSRLDAENGFNMGRSAEITRDEVKFFRFIDRLRNRFADLLMQTLRTQLILRGVMKKQDWESISQDISFKFKTESYFHELKETEMLKERMEILRDMDDVVGKYYSVEWGRKNVLKQTDEEIKEMDKQMKSETDAGIIGGDDEEEPDER